MHFILYWSFKYIIYTLHLCFSQDIAKLGKVYTKVDSCFQKSHEELEKLHTSTGKSKRLKFDGVLSEKNTFLWLKYSIQRICLTLLSVPCVKIHQITDVIFETVSHFSRNNSSVSFHFKHHILSKSIPSKLIFSEFPLLRLKFSF